MDAEKLKKILDEHELWLNSEGGERADLSGASLRGADLSGANLRGANLRWADLRWANLRWANLRWANLRGADLRGANLRWANLSVADLNGASLRGADLSGASLSGADLRWADIDFSCWPLWCESVGVKIDSKISKQLVYHAICNMPEDDREIFLSDPVGYANGFHRIDECDGIEWTKETE